MKAERFIESLEKAESKTFSYSIKDFNITESEPDYNLKNKNVKCNFIAKFSFADTEISLCQGVSIDYYSVKQGIYERKAIEHVDYVDEITLKGFDNLENGSFDLVFLESQLEQHGVNDLDVQGKNLRQLIDLMSEKAYLKSEQINEMLLNAFDSHLLKLVDVDKLVTKESKQRLIDALIDLKMSEFEEKLDNANYQVGNLSQEERTEFHQYISGAIRCSFIFQGMRINAQYYLRRKYSIHQYGKDRMAFNETQLDPYRYIAFESKSGRIDLDLEKKDEALEVLDGNSVLYFKLHSLFALIKRRNDLPVITEKFDAFYAQIEEHT